MKTYKAEYIWIDGTTPVAQLRSKTKVLEIGDKLPLWGFDGSSTNQAKGENSDRVLQPVFVCPDPTRNETIDKLVLCEVLHTDMTPHESNKRHACEVMQQNFKEHDVWFGIEQEYTLFKDGIPLGFVKKGKNVISPQGQYYCGVGSENAMGRDLVEKHLDLCLQAGLLIGGINAEVMPGQWEFQIGPLSATMVSDQLWIARWLLHHIGEKYDIEVNVDAKPVSGDWNGAGAHTNFSTNKMRNSYDACIKAINALEKKADSHVKNYGYGIEKRLTGEHETCSYKEFKWGESDRGASIRIPWQVVKDRKGYIEDRRPNANCDPYITTKLIVETVCEKEVL